MGVRSVNEAFKLRYIRGARDRARGESEREQPSRSTEVSSLMPDRYVYMRATRERRGNGAKPTINNTNKACTCKSPRASSVRASHGSPKKKDDTRGSHIHTPIGARRVPLWNGVPRDVVSRNEGFRARAPEIFDAEVLAESRTFFRKAQRNSGII